MICPRLSHDFPISSTIDPKIETQVLSVMTAWPSKNHHTDITSVMCARTGQMKTMPWMKTTSPHLMVV
jgi:hypothetical protein